VQEKGVGLFEGIGNESTDKKTIEVGAWGCTAVVFGLHEQLGFYIMEFWFYCEPKNGDRCQCAGKEHESMAKGCGCFELNQVIH
jgi:hypothetical protein